MRLVVYDCEVFKYDWLVVFKDHESGQYTIIHNDNEALPFVHAMPSNAEGGLQKVQTRH